MYRFRNTVTMLIFILSLSTIQNVSADKSIVVGLYDEGLQPFSFEPGNPKKGIYLEVLDEVMKITGDKYQVQYYPYARIAKTFSQGKIDIDPGNSPSWITEEDKAFSIFSKPFWHYREALFSGTDNIDKNVRGKIVGTIRGYHYTGDISVASLGYIPHESTNEKNQFKMLAGGRYDYILSGVVVAKYHSKVNGFTVKAIKKFTPTPLTFRLHSSQKELQASINKALDILLKDGTINRIVGKYIDSGENEYPLLD